MLIKSYLKEIKYLKFYIISLSIVISLSYSIYLFCDDDTIIKFGLENSFFEILTPVLFLGGAVFFFLCYKRTKNLFLLGLVILLIFGAGEELSWGQKIFHFSTPKSIKEVNVQKEFNIHNLEIFNDRNLKKIKKTGFQRLLEINFLFRIFCLVFLVCVPLYFFHIKARILTNRKIQMPVPPVTIGIFFFLSWVISYGLKYYILPGGKIRYYYRTTGEIFEFTTAYIYFLVSLYFYNRKSNSFLGKDIKQTLPGSPLSEV